MYFLRKLIIELNSATLNDGRNENEWDSWGLRMWISPWPPSTILTMIHSEGITASLEAVPEVPGQLEEVSTANYLVVDRGLGVEPGALAVVAVGGLVRVTIVLGWPIKPEEWSAVLVFITIENKSCGYHRDRRSKLSVKIVNLLEFARIFPEMISFEEYPRIWPVLECPVLRAECWVLTVLLRGRHEAGQWEE